MRPVAHRHRRSGRDRPFVGADEDRVPAEPQVVALDKVVAAVMVDRNGLRIVRLPACERLVELAAPGSTPYRAVALEDIARAVPEVDAPIAVVGEVAVLDGAAATP